MKSSKSKRDQHLFNNNSRIHNLRSYEQVSKEFGFRKLLKSKRNGDGEDEMEFTFLLLEFAQESVHGLEVRA